MLHTSLKQSRRLLCTWKFAHGVLQLYVKNFLTPGTAKKLYNWCLGSLPWYLVRYEIRQTSITTPRSGDGPSSSLKRCSAVCHHGVRGVHCRS